MYLLFIVPPDKKWNTLCGDVITDDREKQLPRITFTAQTPLFKKQFSVTHKFVN